MLFFATILSFVLLLGLLLFLQADICTSTGTASTTTTTTTNTFGKDINEDIDLKLNMEVMEWAKTNGAYIHDHVQIQRIPSATSKTLSGLFASDTIEKGEHITIIPYNLTINAYISSKDYSTDNGYLTTEAISRNMYVQQEMLFYGDAEVGDGDVDGDGDGDVSVDFCPIMQAVHSAIAKDASLHTPYDKYLKSRIHAHLPYNWSTLGTELLHKILGPKLLLKFGSDSDHEQMAKTCGFVSEKVNDPLVTDAYMLTKTRMESGGYVEALAPVLDLFNHANGKAQNVDSHHKEEANELAIYATRRIEKGEQMFYSYNRCSYCTCFEMNDVVTPDLFYTYGFVEAIPQRWRFKNHDIVFDVVEVDGDGDGDGDDDGVLGVEFTVAPKHSGITLMKNDLQSLKQSKSTLQELLERLPKVERDSISDIYNAVVKALILAIKASEILHSGINESSGTAEVEL